MADFWTFEDYFAHKVHIFNELRIRTFWTFLNVRLDFSLSTQRRMNKKDRHVSQRSGLKVSVDKNKAYCYFLPFINWFALFMLS